MKQKLLKTALVALALVTGSMGVKAAETTTIYERGTATATWTEENLSDFTGNAITLSEYGACYITNANSSDKSTRSISISDNAIVNVDAYWYGISNIGSYYSDGCGMYFRYGNIFVAQNDQDQKHAYGLTGIDNIASATKFKGTNAYRNYDISTKRFLHIEIEINTANNILNYFRISEEGSSTYLVNVTDVALENPDYSIIEWGFKKAKRTDKQRYQYLKSIVVTETPQEVASYDYTVNFVDTDGNVIKDSSTRSGIDGESISLLGSDKSPIVFDDTKYMYVEDDCDGKKVTSAGTHVTVKFRKAYTATLNVTTKTNGVSNTVNTNLVEADDYTCNWRYTYPLFVLKDGVYYQADNTSTFGEEGTFKDGDVIDKTVTYSKASYDIVFFAENQVSTSLDLDCSNGDKGNVASQNKRDRGIYVGTLPAGQYSFEVSIVAANRRSVCLRQSTNDPIASVGTSNSDMTTGVKTAAFTLDAETTNLYINGANSGTERTNQSEEFDYAVIRKTADLATVSSVGYATYSPSSNVAVPEDVKVYTVTVNAEKTGVVLTPVDAGSVIAAGTGYVIEAAAGTYPFAVSGEAVSEIGENALKVSDGSLIVGESDNIYVLAKRENGSVGFSIVAAGVTIPAGKAYLQLTAGAKVSFLSFDDATAIESIESNNANTTSGEYYSLQGVRTSAPVKGLYIINGKKVVVK